MRTVLLVLFVSLLIAACAQPAATNQSNNAAKTNAANSNANTNASKPMPTLDKVAVDPAADSVYTDLSDKACKEQEPEPDSGAIYQAECPGTAGYKVIWSASDHSQVISVIDPQGKDTLLPLARIISSAAGSRLGDKIEWRMGGKGDGAKPHALIVRLSRFIDPENFDKTESFLAVSRLTGEPCVTDLVPASADQNKKAREFADTNGRKCMEVKGP